MLDLLAREVAPRLERQARGYASARLFAWLRYRPAFTDPPEASAQLTGELWAALQRLVPGVETAECFLNGAGSSPGIRPHKDATYAAREAWLLNLGPTTFRIWLPRDEAAPAGATLIKGNPTLIGYALPLEGGELLAFDCKRLHGSHSTATQRWAIGMWRFNETWKAKARFGA